MFHAILLLASVKVAFLQREPSRLEPIFPVAIVVEQETGPILQAGDRESLSCTVEPRHTTVTLPDSTQSEVVETIIKCQRGRVFRLRGVKFQETEIK